LNNAIVLRRLGRVDYAQTAGRMQAFTAARQADTPDELWLLEHPPVYTVGVRARHRLVRPTNDIPVIVTDRGGDITYHGPGQPVIYVLLDLVRHGLGIHSLVHALEQATIDTLTELGVTAARRPNAPGVYVEDRKIASLGLRVRAGRSYHGLAFNACMDLAPFHAIDPCGYPGLRMTQLSEWRPDIEPCDAGERLAEQVHRRLGYTDSTKSSNTPSDVAFEFNIRH
jgi:lipoyl(octanoyl) transferase